MTRSAALLLVLVTAGVSLAQSPDHGGPRTVVRTVIFHTQPEGAAVKLSGTIPLRTLGYSGERIALTVPVNVDIHFGFILSKPGYADNIYELDSKELKQPGLYNLPEDGTTLLLIPNSPLTLVRDLVVQNLHAAAIGVVVVILLILGWRMRMHRLLRLARRGATLSTLTSGSATSSTMAEASLVGQKLGQWWLTEKLGKGGMAVVYRGVPDDTLDTTQAVAIKVINDGLLNPEGRARFEREVRIGAKLNHPNIVRIIDWDLGGPYFYLAMELVEGAPLRSRLSPEGLPPRLAMDLMMPIFDAMIYAHSQGVWHRDLKPENVFVSRANRITVMDFGISRQSTDVTVTATDRMPVTPGYMSPEQFSGKNVAAASDQYTLGIMLWEILVGHRPFHDPNPMVVVMQHIGMPLPSIRDQHPELSDELDLVIQRMCAKNQLERYPDLQTAVEALEAAI